MNLEQSWEKAKIVDGWFSAENAKALYEHAMMSKVAMVEVGVYRGRSSTMLLGAAQELKTVPVYLIDNWIWAPGRPVDEAGSQEASAYLQSLWPCHILKMDSAAAASQVLAFDFIHIDGLHDQGYPELDCNVWLPRLQPGGIACFHDYGYFQEVTEAVDKHTASWENLGLYDSLAIRRKP